ncbi:MAG: stage V sporulation protein AA [bacterium]|nr:stage V sporulation protein AA [bacterium]MCM1375418.1 stage V sporulation protein AA [Muribaculum sp.]
MNNQNLRQLPRYAEQLPERAEEIMSNATVYLKCDRNVECQNEDVFLKDIASLQCADAQVLAKCKAIKVHHFRDEEQAQGGKSGDNKIPWTGGAHQQRCVISVLKVIAMVEEACPGISVQSVGEADVVLERVQAPKYKGPKLWCKVALVCLVSFFGTGFTIIAFHNDVGINDVFTEIYRIAMGREPEGVNVLEVFYSLGLALGIIVFFNHIGGRRITKDPTPIEVSMRNYEEDVNKALVDTAGREGKEVDA